MLNNQIAETFNQVSNFSLKKKREHEEIILNNFLDKILKLQTDINNDCDFLEGLVERFEMITWAEDTTPVDKKEQELNMVNGIIAITMDIHRSILKRYIFLNKNAKQFASMEIKRLKISLDDIKESCNDFEEIMIILPKDINFQSANDKLNNL